MFRLRSVGVLSCARIFAVIHGVLGILMAIVLLAICTARFFAVSGQDKLLMFGLMGMSLVVPLIYAAIGFVMGAVWAFIYNLVAQKFGGMELALDAVPTGPVVTSAAPFA
jgi:transmembrane protein DUF3566